MNLLQLLKTKKNDVNNNNKSVKKNNSKKKSLKKNSKIKRQEKINVYSIKPINVLYLHPEEQRSVIHRFQRVVHVASSGRGCVIEMHREMNKILVGTKKSMFPFNKIEIRSEHDLSEILATNGFTFTVQKTKQDTITRQEGRTVINDLYTECFSMYSTKISLPISWIGNEVFSKCNFIKIFVKKIGPLKKKRVLSKISIKQTGANKIKSINGTEMLDVIRQREDEGVGKLLHVKVVVGVQANNKKILQEKVKNFKEWCESESVEFHQIPYSTKDMFLNGGPYNIVIESSSLYSLMPFFVTDLYESGGIILGYNVDTGAPVKYHYPRRRSYHVSIIAPSGSGKSFAIKIWVTRLLERYPDAFVFITDVENEYINFGKKNGFNVIQVMPYTELGLDPFSYMAGYKAAEMIADIVGAPTLVKNEIISIGSKDCISTMNLYEKLVEHDKLKNENYSGYLRHITAEPIISLITGKPQFGKRTILSMRNSIKIKSTSHRFVTILALEYIMEKAMSLDVNIPKIVILDEFWSAISSMEEGNMIDYVDGLIRRGRKYNVILMFATQNISDVLAMQKVKAMFENTGTQVFMGQKSTEVDALTKVIKLPVTEVETLVSANSLEKRGEGMIHVGNEVIRIQFVANEDEMATFSTQSAEEGEV